MFNVELYMFWGEGGLGGWKPKFNVNIFIHLYTIAPLYKRNDFQKPAPCFSRKFLILFWIFLLLSWMFLILSRMFLILSWMFLILSWKFLILSILSWMFSIFSKNQEELNPGDQVSYDYVCICIFSHSLDGGSVKV